MKSQSNLVDRRPAPAPPDVRIKDALRIFRLTEPRLMPGLFFVSRFGKSLLILLVPNYQMYAKRVQFIGE